MQTSFGYDFSQIPTENSNSVLEPNLLQGAPDGWRQQTPPEEKQHICITILVGL